MKITIDRAALLKPLAHVQSVVERRNTIPILANVMVRAADGLLSLTATDMDLTVKLGLGYPEGPIELLERTGLHHHHDVSKALFEVYGTRHYAPARRAVVAKRRSEAGR